MVKHLATKHCGEVANVEVYDRVQREGCEIIAIVIPQKLNASPLNTIYPDERIKDVVDKFLEKLDKVFFLFSENMSLSVLVHVRI
jgi:hypothetical protein